MGERRRFRPPAVLPALAAAAAFALAVGVVVWWLVVRPEAATREPAPPESPERIEARGPPDEPLPVPGPDPGPTGLIRAGVTAHEARVSAALREPLPTAPLEGPLRARLANIVWDDPAGRPFARAEAVLAFIDVGALSAGGILVEAAVVRRPAVYLERRSEAVPWNYERVFAGFRRGVARPPLPNGVVPPVSIVRVRDVEIEDGTVVVRPPGADVYRFASVDASLPRVDLAVPGEPARLDVARLDAVAEFPEPVGRRLVAAANGVVRLPEDRVVVDVARLTIDRTIVTGVAAVYVPALPGPGLEAVARVERLPFTDVRFLSPELPPEGVASFDLALEPEPGGRTAVRLAELVATAGGSRATGAVAFSVGPDARARLLAADLRLDPLTIPMLERFVGPLPYDGVLRGSVRGEAPVFAFDVTARLTTAAVAEPFVATIAGSVTFAEDGFALRAADIELEDVPLAALRPVTGPLPLAVDARVTGRITLRGPPGAAPLTLDVSLGLAGGVLTLAGTLDLTGAVPAYDLQGRMIGLSLAALLEPEVPPVSLTARFSLVGRGTALASADTRFTLTGAFTGWETGPADTVVVRGAVSDGTLGLDAAALRLATLGLTARGSWRFLAPAAGGLTYALDVASLEPFAPFLLRLEPGETAGGAVRTEGTLSGTLEVPRLAGALEGEALEYGEWAAETLEVEYDVAFADPLPLARVRAVARELEAPGDAAYDTAAALFVLDESRFALEATADRTGGGDFELVSDGRVEPDGAVEALVRRLNITLDSERWSLARTARVDWSPDDGLRIRDLLLREEGGDGRVAVAGRIPPTAAVSLRVEVAALPVGPIFELLGREPVVSGDLWAAAQATGPADDPSVRLDFRLLEGRLDQMYATRVEGALLFEGSRLTAEAVAVLDTFGVVNLEASLPVALDLTALPDARLIDGAPLRASLRADSLPLAAVTMLTPEIREAEGLLRANAVVTGTPDAPYLDGALQIWNGAVTIPAFNQRYEEITADLVLENRVVLVREARARSDGWARAMGVVAFPSLMEPVLDLTVDFDGFRPLGVENQDDAGVWGELRIAGEATAPTVTGDVTLDDGTVEVPSFGGDDFAAEFAGLDGAQLEPIAALEQQGPAPWLERVALDEVIVEAGDDVWFMTEQARARLTGELVLVKAAGDEDVRIFGDVEGDRGTFTLRVGPLVRRFDIVSAEIRFFGTSPPNPALDVVATRTVPSATGEPIEIRLEVGGTVNAPTVAVTTAEGANVPESELISFLLFGQPSFALANGAGPIEPVLEEAIFGVGSLAEVASIELEETLIADLGLPLDYFQIQPAPGPVAGFGAPRVAFGRELADDVFLTVNLALADVFGADAGPETWTATIHWRIDPEWSLELGIAPVHRRRLYAGPFTAIPVANPEQQFVIELLRRWAY
ncbi:MAG TPA: translocation/assembly module TamB domain-containing protein [Longimicrobiales bacterium]